MKIDRPVGRLRAADYPDKGEQLGALWKIIDAILPHLSPAALDAIPTDALDVLQDVAAVKERFPKR